MDVVAGGQVHDRIGPPPRGPDHLLDLLLDGGGHRRVADVGVDLHQEVAADDHRLRFRVVDVGGDDGPAPRHLVAHEFGRDLLRNRGAEGLARQSFFPFRIRVQRLPLLVFAEGDVFHLGGDDAPPCVMQLGDGLSRPGAQHGDPVAGEPFPVPGLLFRAVTVVHGPHFSAFVDFHVAAVADPRGPNRLEALAGIDRDVRVGVRSGGIVNQKGGGPRSVFFPVSGPVGRAGERDFPERHSQVGVQDPRDVYLPRFRGDRGGGDRVESVPGVGRFIVHAGYLLPSISKSSKFPVGCLDNPRWPR